MEIYMLYVIYTATRAYTVCNASIYSVQREHIQCAYTQVYLLLLLTTKIKNGILYICL